jgi:hypothetical protein
MDMISSCSAMSLMLWPFIKYHKVLEKIETAVKPVVSRVEEKLNIKRKRRRAGKGIT